MGTLGPQPPSALPCPYAPRRPPQFGCEVGADSFRGLGVMDDKIFNYELALGTSLSMSKADRLKFGQSAMTHGVCPPWGRDVGGEGAGG